MYVEYDKNSVSVFLEQKHHVLLSYITESISVRHSMILKTAFNCILKFKISHMYKMIRILELVIFVMRYFSLEA